MRYLFDHWDSIELGIRNASGAFLFLDYDGTLTPIVSAPEKARLSPAVKNLMRALVKDRRFNLAVISGRSLKDIKKIVGLKGIVYAGNHGLEIMHTSGKISGPVSFLKRAPLKTIYLALERGLKDIKGVRVEDKGCTLSVHFRLVKSGDRVLVRKIFNRILKPHILSKSVRISSGKMVLEVRPPVQWDKGKAVLYLIGRRKNALPLYIGDDVTDIDAFRAIKKRGTSVFVGNPKQGISADYFLRNPKEVESLLRRLVKL